MDVCCGQYYVLEGFLGGMFFFSGEGGRRGGGVKRGEEGERKGGEWSGVSVGTLD